MSAGLLTGCFPEGVSCGGKFYRIFSDFRTWIQMETILFETEGEFYTKLPKLLKLCYPVLPDSLEGAVSGMVWFYRGGPVDDEQSQKRTEHRRLFSFQQDAAAIYAGFYQQYGIDLSKVDMHWFQFKALFAGLSENTQFSRMVGYRAVDVSGIKSEERRRFYYKMKTLYRLKDYRTEREKELDISRALEGLF